MCSFAFERLDVKRIRGARNSQLHAVETHVRRGDWWHIQVTSNVQERIDPGEPLKIVGH